MRIHRLTGEHEQAIEELLVTDPVVNLFLLGFVTAHPIDRAWWYGSVEDERVTGLVLVLPNRLCVPFIPDASAREPLARYVASLHAPCMSVGPREDVDALWAHWREETTPDRSYDQRLYVLSGPPSPGPLDLRVRRAVFDEWRVVAQYAAAMEMEDLGRDPSAQDPRLHDQVVQERIKAGRTWVLEHGGEIVYQINVGTVTPWGCQIGGTYVPVAHRNQGWATVGTAEVCRRLLASHPLVTLHVNEANTAAVRVYEKVGFRRGAPLRLVIL